MTFDFTGKRVVVCGGSRGIGRSIALGFAEAGAAVSICARGADSLAATRGEMEQFGRTAHAAPCDLADGAAIARYPAISKRRRRLSAASTCWSTTPRASAPATTRWAGRRASRST
jgi:NAD(P)-dependent dehydrogenase (short-subunit alcohol dehydrogenase family)